MNGINTGSIRRHLNIKSVGKSFVSVREAVSTNDAASELADYGYPDGYVVIAGSQTAGKGRMGRQWFSPPGMGIYMSFILKPDANALQPGLITLAGAAAAAEGIEKATGIKAGIKWPNDLMLEDRKVCGILAGSKVTGGRIRYIILGIGINVYQTDMDFPGQLSRTAISLEGYQAKGAGMVGCGCVKRGGAVPAERLDINRIAAEVINSFDRLYSAAGASTGASAEASAQQRARAETISIWKKYNATIGKQVSFMHGDMQKTGKALDLNERGELAVELPGGETVMLSAGEIIYAIGTGRCNGN